MPDTIDNKDKNLKEERTPLEVKKKTHWIKITWLRRTLKTLMWVIISILLIPVLLYVPFIQDAVVKVAENIVHKSTGMDVSIGKFRLKFPLDVNLQDISVVEASGDTMVRARNVIADVKMLPLLKLDVQLNRLELLNGYYRMLSADSSLMIKVNAGRLEVDDKSSVNIKSSHLVLNSTKLEDGSLSLYMDVWKKKPTPPDTAQSSSAPFVIEAKNLNLNNFKFAMSMLPTIDTLNVAVKQLDIRDAKVDLGENLVCWGLATIADGDFTYLTPDPEYVKTHPAPPSEPSTGPPMRIMGDSIALSGLTALYGVKGSVPQPGFDANYLQFSGVNIALRNFYNESSIVRMPLTRLQARERCGLEVTSGGGTVSIDSIGLNVKNLLVTTPYTKISATADVPFAMMALDENSPVIVEAEGRIGIPDIEAFMPSVKEFTKMVPGRKPLDFSLDAKGSLADLAVKQLDVSMPGVFRLNADGSVKKPLDYKHMVAKISFIGALSDPTLADRLIGMPEMKVPAFTIKGVAEANGLSYGADFQLISDAGDLDATGHVALTPENYSADVQTKGLDVGRFVPDIGLGRVTAHIDARGHGFNPLSGTAMTDAIVNISSIEYNKRDLSDIRLAVSLSNAGALTLQVSSANPGLDFDMHGDGTIRRDDYTFDIAGNLRDINLQSLGMSDSTLYASGAIALKGNVQPKLEIYNVDFNAVNLECSFGSEYIHLPDGLQASLRADALKSSLALNSQLTTVDFSGDAGLMPLIKSFSKVGEIASLQIKDKNIDFEQINRALPNFNLKLDASGRGLLDQLLASSGMRLDTVSALIKKDSLISGNIMALNFSNPSIALDTMTLDLSQRGQLLDYKAHLGNRKGTLDEFAKVNLSGYLGTNRVSAFLNQWNIRGEQGYRIGLTAAMRDSVVTAHITPLKSTIAYLPWSFNDDNFIDLNLVNKHIEANLKASSEESSILVRTQPSDQGRDELYLNIDNLHIQDFLRMWAFAPQMTGDLNADLHVKYDNRRFSGSGKVGLKNFVYEKSRVGNFDLDLDAGYGLDGNTDVTASLLVNDKPALSAYARLKPSGQELAADSVGLRLTRFPLSLANPFLGNTMVLGGFLNGRMRMTGSFSRPMLNGGIAFDSVTAHIPMAGARLTFGKDPLVVRNNVVEISNFEIFGANKNPLSLTGSVDASKFGNIRVDLDANAQNMQLINSDKRSRDDLYGKIFLNLGATVKGPLQALNINGNVNILGTTDATYRVNMDPAELKSQQDQDVVRFVNFNDTTQVIKEDSIATSLVNMRINADLTISPGAHFEVDLSNNGTDKVELDPTANLNFSQNFMGDMSLTGTLTLGNGYVRYAIPVVGEKLFEFNPSSSIAWNGDVLNPTLNISATDEVKANVTSGNNSRLVNFLVTVHATNSLKNLKASFDLSTNDDLSIQNELQSMSADQRQTQAMNLLLYGQYSGQNTKASAASGNVLYSFLESQLNSWAAKNIRGVDLTFGVNQYDKMTNGVTNTETSYSYQVSKSLFNNRFKILVGGNYSTDSADDEIADNLVSDVAFEYIIKQTQTTNMSVRLFRHIGYESILEGEITEMGGAFVYKRRLGDFRNIFRKHRQRSRQERQALDSAFNAVTARRDSTSIIPDSVLNVKKSYE